jgi:hypothetical protein
VEILGLTGKRAVSIDEGVQNDPDNHDWIVISASDREFKGYSGTNRLADLLDYAVDWLGLPRPGG